MLAVDGKALRPFLASPDHLLFALRLPVRRLEWRGGILGLELIQAGAATPLPLEGLPGASPLRHGHGRAVLVVRPAAPAMPTAERLIFLSGDSRPKDADFHHRLRAALPPYLADRVESEGAETGIPPEQALPRSLEERLDWLTRLVEAAPDPGRLVLMGRSSGARIASLVAERRLVRGVVCLGYPFRHPLGPPDQPDRYRHLPRLRTPLLLMQGLRDPYGGAQVPERYGLPDKARLVLLDTDHGFRGEPPVWGRVAREILLFLGHEAGDGQQPAQQAL